MFNGFSKDHLNLGNALFPLSESDKKEKQNKVKKQNKKNKKARIRAEMGVWNISHFSDNFEAPNAAVWFLQLNNETHDQIMFNFFKISDHNH